MRIRYDAGADILFVEFSDSKPVDAVEEPGGVVVSYDDAKRPVSVEFLNATANRLVHDGRFDVEIG